MEESHHPEASSSPARQCSPCVAGACLLSLSAARWSYSNPLLWFCKL